MSKYNNSLFGEKAIPHRLLCGAVLLCLILFGNIHCAIAQDSLLVDEYRRDIVSEEFKREEMRIRFIVAKDNIEMDYMNNAKALDSIVKWVDRVQRDSMVDIVSVEFCGAVSPEGSVRFNRWLSNARLTALEKYVRERIYIPEELIVRNDHYISWSELDSLVVLSNLSNKEDVLRIIRSKNRSEGEQLDSRIGDLKRLDNGKTWRLLFNNYFHEMRNAYTVLVTKKSSLARRQQKIAMHDSGLGVDIIPFKISTTSYTEPRYMYVKTNLVDLALLGANIGVEFDVGRYLSINLPVSYSAVNYFKSTVKFRHFSLQPELRVWPMTNYDRLFIGAHVGFAYYNYAFGGQWRYQDHNGCSPTIGGGITLGYRLPISKDKRWKLEFAVGAGVYPLYYDVFHNVDNVKEGQLFDTRRKTYVGIDNVMVGISYRIPMKKSKPFIVE